jgi:polysaccharide export outer membrane protein
MPSDVALEYAQPYTISGEGFLKIPLVGPVRAAGLTQSQLEQTIERKLVEAEIFRFPYVAIVAQARFVTVGGAVKNSGRLPWSPDLSLLTGISAAGGRDEFAGDKVELIRGGKVAVYSTKKIRKDPSLDPLLLPGDRLEQH